MRRDSSSPVEDICLRKKKKEKKSGVARMSLSVGVYDADNF